jgi:hypothetical protein
MSSKRNAIILVSFILWSGTIALAYRNGQVIRLSEEKSSFESILDAVTSGGLTATVEVDNSVVLQADRTGPSKGIGRDLTLVFRPGNVISLNGHALEINGAIEAGPFQIFDCGKTAFEAVARNPEKSLVRGRPRVAGIYPQWWGARDDATADASVAFQAAINLAKHPGQARNAGFCRTVNVSGRFLIRNPLNVTKTQGVQFIGANGKNQYNTIYAHTGGVLFDCTGSSHNTFSGFYILIDSQLPGGEKTPSNCAILLASGAEAGFTECLYNEIKSMYIEMYTPGFKGRYGTIGVCGIGTEENTYLSNQMFCDTPIILTAYKYLVEKEIKSVYTEINAAHSSGVNTFSGNNMVCGWNNRSYNMVLSGVNTVSLGNIYFGSVLWPGTTGKNLTAMQLNTNVDVLTGNVKMEVKASLMDIQPGSLVSGVDLMTELGGSGHAGDPDYAVIYLRGEDNLAKVLDFKLRIIYPGYEGLTPMGPPKMSLFGPSKVKDPKHRLEFANVQITTNQLSKYLPAGLPGGLAEVARNVQVSFRDKVITFDRKR